MRSILTPLALVIAAADVWLAGISWRRRSVLAGLVAAGGIPVVTFYVLPDPTQGPHEDVLVIATVLLWIGVGLLCIGQFVQRLLDTELDDRDQM